MKHDRLRELDGLRGIAILLVMGYHYFYALAETGLYPYGKTFAAIPLFKYGYLGVELFFTISGFVIAMTLDACTTPWDFFAKRFARIWPPLLFWSIATFLFIRFVTTPFAATDGQYWFNFLPSLTLTPASAWQWVSPNVRLIDFAYWSLVVEARFYLFAAVLFWAFRRKNLGRNLVILACVNIAMKALLKLASPNTDDLYFQLFIPTFLPWFAAGAVFFDLYKDRLGRPLAGAQLALMLAIIVHYSLNGDVRSPYIVSLSAVGIFEIFWLIARRLPPAKIFRAGFLTRIGACSYSVYLIHFEIGDSIISTIPRWLPVWEQVLLVLVVSVLIVACGYASLRFIERPGKRFVMTLLTGSSKKSASKDGGDIVADASAPV